MMKSLLAVSAVALLMAAPSYAQSAINSKGSSSTSANTQSPARYAYADIAALADQSPIVVDAVIKSASKVGKTFSSPDGSMRQRYFVQADTQALIRGTQAMAKRLSYLVDMPLDSRGKTVKLNKQRVILFARPVSGKPDTIQLSNQDAQLLWDASTERWTRSVITELLDPAAPAQITSVTTAFHAPGNVTGAGETQIFLGTRSGEPASLSISSRPERAPTWSAAFGEVVSESAGAPKTETLTWYRFACGLPKSLPSQAFADGGSEHRAKIEEDYALVLRGLGECTRTLPVANR